MLNTPTLSQESSCTEMTTPCSQISVEDFNREDVMEEQLSMKHNWSFLGSNLTSQQQQELKRGHSYLYGLRHGGFVMR